MFHIFSKFRENISKSFRVIEQKRFSHWNLQRIIVLLKCRWSTILVFCMSSNHVLYVYKVRNNNSKAINQTWFSHWNIYRGIILLKWRWSNSSWFLHLVWLWFIFVPSFVKISQRISLLLSRHGFHTAIYKGALFHKYCRWRNGLVFCTSSDLVIYLFQVF